jgi:hypothetical protein
MIGYLLTGGLLAGYRTYVLSGLAAITAVAYWSIGDQSTSATLQALWELFASGGLAALRAGLASEK